MRGRYGPMREAHPGLTEMLDMKNGINTSILRRNLEIIDDFSPPDGDRNSLLGLQYIEYRYIINWMIKGFRDKDTQALFEGHCPRRWQTIRIVAERKLIQLNAAATLNFLRAPPGNRLEALKGDRSGQFSIRINEHWRVCFTWASGDVFDVGIVDYH